MPTELDQKHLANTVQSLEFFKQKLKNQPLTIVGNGKQKRDFVYVTDVAKAFYQAAILKKTGRFLILHLINLLR